MKVPYRGRFAPSPTGPLHFGSLVSAVGSFCQARSQDGEWLVRIEDLDPPREVPGATEDILKTLEAFHLFWDGPVLFQSQRLDAYEDALNQLSERKHTFPCICTRKSISENNQSSKSTIYPGTCRNGVPTSTSQNAAFSIRVKVKSENINFADGLQGICNIQMDTEVGDFVIRRSDNLFAYHLAVVVDDAYQEISEIVRGTDLLDSTPHHLYLQKLLHYQTPHYIHLPIAVNKQGEKLSKQTHAAAIDNKQAGKILEKALEFLGHKPDHDVINTDPETLLNWAVYNWDIKNIPTQRTISV